MKLNVIFLVVVIAFLSGGCSLLSNKGKSAKAEEKSRAAITVVDNKISSNSMEKMDVVASLSYGVDYSLSKVNDPPNEVVVARDVNKRVMSLAGSPTLDKMKEMQETIDRLTSELESERKSGQKRLNQKDEEINRIQLESKKLEQDKDEEIRKYMVVAQQAAASSDAYQLQLQEYQGWFGLRAVFKGGWQFLKSSLWFLSIGSILFIILRLGAATNPIAGSIFAIFNIIGSWIVNGVKVLFPKALEFAGHTATSVFKAYEGTMTKIIDTIQALKERQQALGDANKKYTLDELMDELSKSMSDDDKKRIQEIKRKIGYN